MDAYPTFSEFARARWGKEWVLAKRRTAAMQRRYPDGRLVSQREYREAEDVWADNHPATALAATLPAGPMGDWIRDEVRRWLPCAPRGMSEGGRV